jgi:hypothetical protein
MFFDGTLGVALNSARTAKRGKVDDMSVHPKKLKIYIYPDENERDFSRLLSSAVVAPASEALWATYLEEQI